MPRLKRCESCACHVRAEESECPFCGHQTTQRLKSSPLGKGVILAGSLVVAAAGMGCGASTEPTTDAATVDAGTDAGAGEDTGTAMDAGEDTPAMPPYGIPPMDAGEDVPVVNPYGIPPSDGG